MRTFLVKCSKRLSASSLPDDASNLTYFYQIKKSFNISSMSTCLSSNPYLLDPIRNFDALPPCLRPDLAIDILQRVEQGAGFGRLVLGEEDRLADVVSSVEERAVSKDKTNREHAGGERTVHSEAKA